MNFSLRQPSSTNRDEAEVEDHRTTYMETEEDTSSRTTWNNDIVVGVEEDDEECAAIEDRCCSFMNECKTPEQEHATTSPNGRSRVFSSISMSRSIRDPPMLKPRYSVTQSQRSSWNIPTEQEQEELSSRLKVHDAPLFPDSPALTSQRGTTESSDFWNHAITASATSTTSSRLGLQQDESSFNTQQHHTRSTSCPRRIVLSFQECHFVRLPPRVSKSDGYLHDISWRIHHMAPISDTETGDGTAGDATTNITTSICSPDRKRTKKQFAKDDDVPLRTPVEGYTIPVNPPTILFSRENTSDRNSNEDSKTDERTSLTFRRDKNYYDADNVVYTSWNSALRNLVEDTSREVTPLPLLDFDDDDDEDDDDSDSLTSSKESSNDRRDQSSDSPTQETVSTSSTSTTAVLSSSTSNTLSRAIPIKPPKLKMRTNHPVLLQATTFSSLLQQQQQQTP